MHWLLTSCQIFLDLKSAEFLKYEIKGDSMNLTLMLYLFLTFLPVTLEKIELQKRALHQMNS